MMYFLQEHTYTASSYMVPFALFLAAQFVSLLVFGITAYVRIQTKIKELEVRLSMAESDDSKLGNKMDQLLDAVHVIDMKLENKQDRPRN